MNRKSLMFAVAACLFFTRHAAAVPMATLTWRTEANATGQYCVFGSYDNATFDVFGTAVNLSSTGDVLCLGSYAPPVSSGHCEAVAGAGVLSFDYSVPTGSGPPPGVGVPAPFVGAISGMSGSAVAGLGTLTYTVDGVQVQRAMGSPSTTIPGCTVTGGVAIFDGQGGLNAFQAVATGTGTHVPVNTTVSFTDPTTGQPQTSAVGITFDNVSSPGETTVTATSSVAGNLSSNFVAAVGGYNAVYFDVSTTATFTGPVEVCGQYGDADNDGLLDGTSVPESALRVLHGEGVPLTFVDRTSSHDVVANVICAEVSTLSPFLIGVDVSTQSSHDGVVRAVKPVKVTLADGKTSVTKALKIKVVSADIGESAGHTAQLMVTSSTCPASVLRNAEDQPVLPDFDLRNAAVGDSVSIAGGKAKVATLPLTIKSADFTTPSPQSPVRCTIAVSVVTTGAGTVIDPNPSNNAVRIEIDVVDKNDY